MEVEISVMLEYGTKKRLQGGAETRAESLKTCLGDCLGLSGVCAHVWVGVSADRPSYEGGGSSRPQGPCRSHQGSAREQEPNTRRRAVSPLLETKDFLGCDLPGRPSASNRFCAEHDISSLICHVLDWEMPAAGCQRAALGARKVGSRHWVRAFSHQACQVWP